MNFQLTEEQQLVIKTVRAFADKEVRPLAAEITSITDFLMKQWRRWAS